ncbi:MAG: hypothetical protein IPJ98_29570 [Bryobacterales bacterium]|nr:hypothetical protein [Bryobacterales bacterium]
MDWLTDLSPFCSDRCWHFVLLARNAPVGLAIRRGPSKWWHLTLWNTRKDHFTGGQWFRGSLYPRKCDLAPDGSLFSYFAGKFQSSARQRGYDFTWVAVSRPPYFTALSLWPVGDTWGGHTMFLDDGAFHAGALKHHHPDHPPGPLRVVTHSYLNLDDPFLAAPPWARAGWKPIPLPERVKKQTYFDPLLSAWRKTEGNLCLERAVNRGEDSFPSHRPSRYTIYKLDAQTELARFEAHWADFDQRGRLVAAVGGRILEGKLDRHRGLRWRQLAGFQDDRPEPIKAPEWAQHW